MAMEINRNLLHLGYHYEEDHQTEGFHATPPSPMSPNSYSLACSWVQQLGDACQLDDETLVTELLKESKQAKMTMSIAEHNKIYNINAIDRQTKRSALHRCMAGNSVNVLVMLLSSYPIGTPVKSVGFHSDAEQVLDVNVKDGQNQSTPMHIAVANEANSCISIFLTSTLVMSKLEKEAKDSLGNTFFHVAFKLKKLSVMELLLRYLGNEVINSRKSNSETCLHIAAKHGDHKGVRWLLNKGAKFLKDENGRKPLASALYSYREDVSCAGMQDSQSKLNLLFSSPQQSPAVEIGAVLTKEGERERGNSAGPKQVNGKVPKSRRRSAGSMPSIPPVSEDDSGFSDEQFNRLNRSVCYSILIEEEIKQLCGGSIKKWLKNEAELCDGMNILQVAASGGNKEFLAICVLFLEKVFFHQLLDKRTKNRYNVLHFAAEGGHCELVESLIPLLGDYMKSEEVQSYLNSKDSNNETPLHKAARKLLRLENSFSGSTPHLLSEKQRTVNCIKYLMYKCNADAELKNNDGVSATDILHEASFFTNQYLLPSKGFSI